VTAPWDPGFFRKSDLFWPIAPAAARLSGFDRWPEPSELACVFEDDAPVRFEVAAPRRSRRPSTTPRYDARITEERTVPTRKACWHDLLNALVWATFPRAKAALHARQHRLIGARLGADARLPGARTPEQDAIAMLDEGGVAVVPGGGSAEPEVIVFGHAIYETLVCTGVVDLRAAGYRVEPGPADRDPRARLGRVDAAIAGLLSRDAPIGRADLTPVDLRTTRCG
jgi:hypothetical protein